MRILLVNKFAHFEGGSARYILDLYDLLKKQGHEVAFFAMQPAKEEGALVRKDIFDVWGNYWVSPVQTRKASYGFEGLRTAFRSLWSFEAQRCLDRLITDFRPDVVHLNSIQRQLSPSIITLIKKRNVPMVMTVHGYELVYPHYFLMVNQLERCKKKSYIRTITEREMRGSLVLSALTWLEFTLHRLLGVYRNVTVFICPSVFLKLLMEHVGYRRTTSLANFYPLPKQPSNRSLGSDFVYVARCSSEKGILELIEAYRRCIQRDLAVPKLVLYSRTGPLLEEVDQRIKDPEFRGLIERREFDPSSFDRMFHDARAVMVPSYPYLENFPYAVTEAFSFGCPVLSSGLGGLSEMVQDGETGWNVLRQTENASREVYVERLVATLERAIKASDEEILRMGENGYDYVSKLTPEWYYGELMKIYNRVIRESSNVKSNPKSK